MIQLIGSLFKALASALGFLEKRQELVNSPEMQANARAKEDQKIKDEGREAIQVAVEKKDLAKLRELASE